MTEDFVGQSPKANLVACAKNEIFAFTGKVLSKLNDASARY